MSNQTSPPPPDSNPPDLTDAQPVDSIGAGWSVHSTTIDGVERFYFYNAESKESRWTLPEGKPTAAASGSKKEKWQTNQNEFILKYYDKAKGGFGPQKLADDPRYKHLRKED